MRQRYWVLITGLFAVLVGCGGGGDTTVIKTVDAQPQTLLPDVATTRTFEQPSEYGFSVDGDLRGTSLSWSGWGSPTATASGTFKEILRPSGEEATYDGTMTVSNPVLCNGKSYYTHIDVELPANALFQPQLVDHLFTPCD